MAIKNNQKPKMFKMGGLNSTEDHFKRNRSFADFNARPDMQMDIENESSDKRLAVQQPLLPYNAIQPFQLSAKKEENPSLGF